MRECDLLLFVATQTERDLLRAAAVERGAAFDDISGEAGEPLPGESYWLGTIGAERVIAVKTRMGAIGDGGSAALGLKYVSMTRATSIICLGMAFGISPTLQNYGDVLVSTSVFPYDDREVISDGESWRYEYGKRAKIYRANPTTIKMLEAHREHVRGFNVLPGCLLSGNAVVRSRAYRDNLFSVAGAEMTCRSLAPKWDESV